MVFPPSLEDLAKINSSADKVKNLIKDSGELSPPDATENPIDEAVVAIVASEDKPVPLSVTGPPSGTEEAYLVAVSTGEPDYMRLFQISKTGEVTVTPKEGFVDAALSVETETRNLSDMVHVASGLGRILLISTDGAFRLYQPGTDIVFNVDSEGSVSMGKVDGKLGFLGSEPVERPSVPSSPTAQNIVDALVDLGLIKQEA